MAATRCGPLCQHPGCWQFVDRERNTQTNHNDSPRHVDGPNLTYKSGVQDGDLPTISIKDATQEATLSPLPSPPSPSLARSSTLPALSPSQRSLLFTPSSPWASHRQLHFNQFLLHQEEEQENYNDKMPSEGYEFIPIFLWKPNNKKYNKGRQVESDLVESGEEKKLLKINNHIGEGLPPDSRGQLHCMPRKNLLEVKRERGSHGGEPSSGQSFGFTIDKYIVDGLNDVSPHIVDQIIQQLKGQKHVKVIDNDATTNTPPPPSSRPLKPSHAHIPSSLVLNLSSQKLYRTSSSGFLTPQSNTPPLITTRNRTTARNKGSFSRTLARRPSEALTGLKARIADLQNKAHQSHSIGGEVPNNNGLELFPSYLELPHTNSEVYTKYMSPRTLTKALRQRLYSHCPAPPFSGAPPSNKPLPSINSKPMRQYSEDVLSRPRTDNQTHTHTIQGSRSNTNHKTRSHINQTHSHATTWDPHTRSIGVRPHSRTTRPYSHAPSSAMSSDHVIYDANITSTNGLLVLMNREGQVIHEVSNVTPSVPLLEISYDEKEEGGEEAGLLEGTIAPPPSARDEIDDTTPSNNGSTPSNQLATPTHIGAPPSNQVTTPTYNGATPSNQLATPTHNGVTPSNQATTPTHNGATPSNQITTPAHNEATP